MPVIVTGEQAEVTDGTVQVMCLNAPLSRIGRARPGDAEASTHVATGGRASSSAWRWRGRRGGTGSGRIGRRAWACIGQKIDDVVVDEAQLGRRGVQQEDLLTHDAVVDALVKHHRAGDASETGDLGDERSQREVLVNSVVSNQHDRVEGVTHAVVNFNVQGVARVGGSGRRWHS